jgi:ribosomal protein S13
MAVRDATGKIEKGKERKEDGSQPSIAANITQTITSDKNELDPSRKQKRIAKSTIASALSGWSIAYIVFPYALLLLLGLTPPGWVLYSIAGVAAISYAVSTAISKNKKINNEKNRQEVNEATIKKLKEDIKNLENKLINLAKNDVELYTNCKMLQSLNQQRNVSIDRFLNFAKKSQLKSQSIINDVNTDSQKLSKLDRFRTFKTGITAATVA